MRVLVFGATGDTGREVVAQALASDHRITAFVRTPSRLGELAAAVTVVEGDVMDREAVHRATGDQHAVICCLGAATPLRRDPRLVQGVKLIVEAMESRNVRRLVYLSFLGVNEGRQQLSFIGRAFVAPIVLRNVVADHAAKEEIIRRSTLDWIIVRPPRLTHGRRRGAFRHGVDIRATSAIPRISRADLADFMLRQLEDEAYVRRAPAVMY